MVMTVTMNLLNPPPVINLPPVISPLPVINLDVLQDQESPDQDQALQGHPLALDLLLLGQDLGPSQDPGLHHGSLVLHLLQDREMRPDRGLVPAPDHHLAHELHLAHGLHQAPALHQDQGAQDLVLGQSRDQELDQRLVANLIQDHGLGLGPDPGRARGRSLVQEHLAPIDQNRALGLAQDHTLVPDTLDPGQGRV